MNNEARGNYRKVNNEQLALRIQAGIDVAENMLKLWEQNQGLIHMLAKKYKYLADEEELCQEGYFGLCEAVEHWDPDRGGSFSTVLFQYVRLAMYRYYENNGTVRLPVGAGERVRKYEKLRAAFCLKVGREPTDRELCYYLDVSRETLERIRKDAKVGRLTSLDKPVGEEQDTSLGDLLPNEKDMEGEVLEHVLQDELRAVIWPLVDSLPGKIPKVLRARYQDQKTLKEIGEEEGCCLDNIRQIEQKGLYELRKSHRARLLEPFLDEYIEAEAYRGNGVEKFNRTWTSSTERTALELVEDLTNI